MSQNESVMYPASYDQDVPSEAELYRRLVDGGLIVKLDRPHHEYWLSTAFMTPSEREIFDAAVARGGGEGQPVEVRTYDEPTILLSSQIQYVEVITAPDGSTFGGPDLVVEDYLVAMHEDFDATTTDPASGKTHLIRELNFEHTTGLGKMSISISGHRTAEDCRLAEVGEMVGFALKYCYLGG